LTIELLAKFGFDHQTPKPVSSTIQLSKPFTFDHPTVFRAVLVTWTTCHCAESDGAHTSSPSPSSLSLLSSPSPLSTAGCHHLLSHQCALAEPGAHAAPSRHVEPKPVGGLVAPAPAVGPAATLWPSPLPVCVASARAPPTISVVLPLARGATRRR
jgi:hypothetical protein